MDPKKLYRKLAADFKSQIEYRFSDRGEDMLEGRQVHGDRMFLVNKNIEEAYEILDYMEVLCHWDLSAIDMTALETLHNEEYAWGSALSMSARFDFDVGYFKNGVAAVNWCVQPDGRYWADDDGFGSTKDREIYLTAFIDKRANILIPFQEMDYETKNRYRLQAAIRADNPKHEPYISLQPLMTIPYEENARIEDYSALIYTMAAGMSAQIRSQINHIDLHPDKIFESGVVINPTRERYVHLKLAVRPYRGKKDCYELSSTTTGYIDGHEDKRERYVYLNPATTRRSTDRHKSEESMGGFGTYSLKELKLIMLTPENAAVFANDFIEAIKKL